MNLSGVSYLLQGSNAPLHNGSFFGPVEDLLDNNGGSISSIDNTLIVLYRNKDALLVKHLPVLLDKHVDLLLYMWVQMGEVKVLFQLLTVFGLIISTVEFGVDLIKGRWWMF